MKKFCSVCCVFLCFVCLTFAQAAGTNAGEIPVAANVLGSPPAPDARVIGIIGGVSWASSAMYYQRLNEKMRDTFGPLYSANVLMYSIPFHDFAAQERLALSGDWVMLTETMLGAAQRLQAGGADFIIVASNTLNSLNPVIEEATGLHVVGIAEAVGRKVVEQNIKRVILLGTAYTMESDFYRKILEQDFGLTVIVPSAEERAYINKIIFDELCNNTITDAAREGYKKIIARLVEEEHAEGVILGCTEIPLLIKQADVSVPVFDSTEIHVDAALAYATGGK